MLGLPGTQFIMDMRALWSGEHVKDIMISSLSYFSIILSFNFSFFYLQICGCGLSKYAERALVLHVPYFQGYYNFSRKIFYLDFLPYKPPRLIENLYIYGQGARLTITYFPITLSQCIEEFSGSSEDFFKSKFKKL